MIIRIIVILIFILIAIPSRIVHLIINLIKKIMKKLLIILFFIPLGMSAQSDQIVIKFGKDKLYHATAGVTISASVILASKYIFKREMNPIAPTLIAATIGAGKEVYDGHTGGRFSDEDFLTTAISAVIINIIPYIKFKKRKKKIKQDPFDKWEIKKNQL